MRAQSCRMVLPLGASPRPRESFLHGACPDDAGAPEPCEGDVVAAACRESWCEPGRSRGFYVERAELDGWAAAAGHALRCAPVSDGRAPLPEPSACPACGA